MNNQDREYLQWLELCKRIKSETTVNVNESAKDKESRIKKLLANPAKFCQYYFPHYMTDKETGKIIDFGWFHLEAFDKILKDRDCFAVLEWAREHAKSVISGVFIPMILKAKGELTGMVTVSSNEKKANKLLGDIQAELLENQRFIADFGEQAAFGDWRTGNFTTKDGCGFWAFGRGQSPRGIRNGNNRPNYAVFDDIDDKDLVKNQTRVLETVDYILEDVYGCLAIDGGRLIGAGNRIHKKSVLAHIVGDIDGKPKRKGLVHIKVFAIEDKNHNACEPNHPEARLAWKAFHKWDKLIAKMQKMGYRSAQREYFHNHIEEGILFKNEWIHYTPAIRIDDYDALVCYCDPSFKDTKNSDFKSIMAVGRKGHTFQIRKAFVRQCSPTAMVNGFYDMYDLFGRWAKYYMEANFLQDLLLAEFDRAAEERKQSLPIRGDKESKPNKFERIENITPLFERGLITIAEEEKNNPDMQVFLSQLLGFGNSGVHDDAPDALEGAISKLQKKHRNKNATYAVGNYSHDKRRY
jgi:phage terminase large subunit-like protein